MWGAIANALLGFVSGPVLSKALDAYKAKLAASNDADRIAADLAAKDMALKKREAELADRQNERDEGRWWTAAPRALVCWSFALYVFHMVVWSGMWGFGRPFPLTGDLGKWAGLVMVAWFGGRSAEKVARILRG